MNRTIGIFTTTRAEFGIMMPLIHEISRTEGLDYKLFVGGTHLVYEHGKTIDEIRKEQFEICDTFDFFLNEDTVFSLAKSSGLATIELAHIFKNYDFDFVLLLGDRFELLSIIQTAIIFKKAIVHLHGGERTEGAIDEKVRHMITKSANIHFAICDEYAQNIIKMGEAPKWVYNTGALAIDNILHNPKTPKDKLFQTLNIDQDKGTILFTYHPVTLEMKTGPIEQINNLFSALNDTGYQVVITASNIDFERELLFNAINREVKKSDNYFYFDSLGVINYYSLLPHCEFVIGNSSSGIIEVPYFKIPTINIGKRQLGRIQHESIINVDYTIKSISEGIHKAMNKQYRKSLQSMQYKFGDGNVASKMVNILKEVKIDEELLSKKLIFS